MPELLGNGAFQLVICSFADELGQLGTIGIDSFDTIANLDTFGGFFLEFDFCAILVCNLDTAFLSNVVEFHN